MNTTELSNLYLSQQSDITLLQESTDVVWVSVATYLVFFMQAGFAMLEVGSVRHKNAQNILLKNFIDICIATLTWWLLGYGFAFGDSSGDFIGSSKFAGKGFEGTNHYRDWMFQWAFAGTAATIVSGCLAERTKLLAYVIFAFVITTFIYPVVVNWTWGGGWLTELGYVDFAGSGIVHMVGGVAGLVGAMVLGPRINRFDSQNSKEFSPHNVPFVVFGTFILWLGWYGFNCGSTLSAIGDSRFDIAKVGMVTTISAASAGLMSFLLDARYSMVVNNIRKVSVVPSLTNGVLAGLVGITAGCGSVEPYAAFIIGIVSGLIWFHTSRLLVRQKIDDPLDAFAVHGACGAWGVFAVGLFDINDGLFYDGSAQLLGYQIAGILTISLWTGVLSYIVFYILQVKEMLRVSPEEEEQGLDKFEMGGSAYRMNSRISSNNINMTDVNITNPE